MAFPYPAILFDFDGVLANTEPLHFKAFQAVLKERAFSLDAEEYYRAYVHHDDPGVFRAYYKDRGRALSATELKELVEAKSGAFRCQIPTTEMLFPQTRGVVRTLSGEAALAIVSMAARIEVRMILERAGILERFAAIAAADDFQRGKPDPEPYLMGLSLVNAARPEGSKIAACDALVVEDSLGGVRAGLAAGMKVCAITNTVSADELRAAGAQRIIGSLDELLAIGRIG